MIHPVEIENTFQEELYVIPSKPVVAIPSLWDAIRENEKILLEKILASARLTPNHVSIISTSKLDVVQWKDRPSRVIAFGIDAPGLSKHDLIEIQGIKLIVATSLAELDTDNEAKKKLWNSLKQMFLG